MSEESLLGKVKDENGQNFDLKLSSYTFILLNLNKDNIGLK